LGQLQIVAGTQLKAKVDFWTAGTLNHVSGVDALMLSFGEILQRRTRLDALEKIGLGEYLGFRGHIFLDNGSYTMLGGGLKPPIAEYVRFVRHAKPDWFPVPVDYVPSPSASRKLARRLAEQTAEINEKFGLAEYVPVIHMGPHFSEYFRRTIETLKPKRVAIGGMVPYVRFARGANPRLALQRLADARKSFEGSIHVFGLAGGITSVHITAALGIDSADSSGWRVRAARGFILVPGRGERMIQRIGGWEGPTLSTDDIAALKSCRCGTCTTGGLDAFAELGKTGFEHRAVHNLWVLSREAALLNNRSGQRLKSWSLARLRLNRMRYLVEHAFDLTHR
jgi:hypothetical protein